VVAAAAAHMALWSPFSARLVLIEGGLRAVMIVPGIRDDSIFFEVRPIP